MEWYRIRESITKQQLEFARFNIEAYINNRLVHAAHEAGAALLGDRLVYMKRADDWYVEYGLDVNPPEYVIEKMKERGWEIVQ